jgi:hypothetical protein
MVVVRSAPGTKMETGREVRVSWRDEAIHWFDAATGVRLH